MEMCCNINDILLAFVGGIPIGAIITVIALLLGER